MKFHRVKLSSWTSSFRYPNLISGYQPTLDVPPLSTVLGLMNASAGQYLHHQDLKIGYYFDFEAKTTDLETIYQIELKSDKKGVYPSNAVKSNVMNREFLFNCRLFLYLQDEQLVHYFNHPYYSLVLGRSGDLVTVDDVLMDIEFEKRDSASNIKGQVIPFEGNYLPGEIQALPKYFTNTIPRQNIGTEPFSVIAHHSENIELDGHCFIQDKIDNQLVDIYIHQLNIDEQWSC